MPEFKDIISKVELYKREKIIQFTLAGEYTLSTKIYSENNQFVWHDLVRAVKDELKKTKLDYDELDFIELTLNDNVNTIFDIFQINSQAEIQRGEQDKKKFSTLKYSGYNNELNQLYESVLVGGHCCFINFKEGRIQTFKNLEEEDRILVPPNINEVPHHPYTFTDEEEIIDILNFTKSLKFGDIFKLVKQTVSKYVSHDEYTKTLISADIVCSFFPRQVRTNPLSTFHWRKWCWKECYWRCICNPGLPWSKIN